VAERPARRFTQADLTLAENLAHRMALAIDNARLLQKTRRHERDLQTLAGRLATAEDEERRRLALDLHDSVGQLLALAKMNLEAAQSRQGSAEAQQAACASALALLTEAIGQVRHMTFDLYPTMLNDLGLVPTLHWYADEYKARTGIQVIVSAPPPHAALRPAVTAYLFRAARELLSNVAKHARAREVILAVRWPPQKVLIEVADDGCGFDPSQLDEVQQAPGLGLISLRERIDSLGGRFCVESQPGQGTRVVLEVPRGEGDSPPSGKGPLHDNPGVAR
jgi:signal transduction histidine kinase